MRGSVGTSTRLESINYPKRAFTSKRTTFCIECRKYIPPGVGILNARGGLVKHISCESQPSEEGAKFRNVGKDTAKRIRKSHRRGQQP